MSEPIVRVIHRSDGTSVVAMEINGETKDFIECSTNEVSTVTDELGGVYSVSKQRLPYCEFKERQSKRFNAFPLKAAFGDKQFKEMLSEWNLTDSKEDLRKICPLVGGTYILMKDLNDFNALVDSLNEEKSVYLKDDENLRDALIYEMDNHECGYTWRFTDAIEALGFETDEFLKDARKRHIFEQARKDFIKMTED